MIDAGKGIEDAAARFGVSVLTVQRRLKLSVLSPKLLALYRQDGINLDQLMALAISDDHAVQERTWFDAQPWERTPAALRRKITAGEIEAAGHALVRFVGIDTYEAAGGVVRRDLFDDEQCRYLSDPPLLQRLATEKLEALAEPVRQEGWAWAEPRVELDAQALRQFSPCDHTLREPTPQERDELAALDRRAVELEQQAQALDDALEWSADEAECIDLEEQDIAARRKAIHESLKTWSADVKAHAGAILTVSREGDGEVIRGLLRDTERKALNSAQKSTGRSPDAMRGTSPDTSASIPAVGEPSAAGCSESLAKRLAAHRTVALQLALSRNTPVALASLAHVLVQRVFAADYRRSGSALQITTQAPEFALLSAADDLKQSAAWQALEAARLAWRERLPEQTSSWLAWLIALPQAELLDLLALCGALTLSALPSAGATLDANAIAEAVNLDMADWWEATPQGYLNHVPKAQIVQALKEAGPDLADDGVAALKKDALVAKAQTRLAGKRWLPAPLRRPPS
jgi:ParB family chromosome partitioning protein